MKDIKTDEILDCYRDHYLSREIQKAIERDQEVSGSLSNIQVKVLQGRVTLTGKVLFPYERMIILSKVTALVGFENIDDQLEVMSEIL